MESPETQSKFQEALEKVGKGESEGMVMHVQTLSLLTHEEWDDMQRVGLEVGVFQVLTESEGAAPK